MRKATMLTVGLFILGIILLGASLAQGGGTVYLALIFPVYSGSDIWGFLGILCIIGALFVGFFSLIPGSMSAMASRQPRQASPTSGEPEKKFGGVVMLGPIPVVFGSDMKMSIVAMILAIILIVVLVVSLLFFLPGLVG